MRLIFAARARRDLDSIFKYILDQNPAAAVNIIDAIEHRCSTLLLYAQRGRVLKGRRRKELRRIVEGQYLIIYVVEPEVISIVRVVHGARDIDSILDEGIDQD